MHVHQRHTGENLTANGYIDDDEEEEATICRRPRQLYVMLALFTFVDIEPADHRHHVNKYARLWMASTSPVLHVCVHRLVSQDPSPPGIPEYPLTDVYWDVQSTSWYMAIGSQSW